MTGSPEPAVTALRDQLNPRPGQEQAWALIDYPALARTCSLLEAPEELDDPFTALYDLSSVIAALIFYDRVLVVEWDPVIERAHRLLGAGDALIGLAPDGPVREVIGPLAPPPWITVERTAQYPTTLTQLFWAVVADLDRATTAGATWLDSLRDRWEALLPGIEWPPHDATTCLEAYYDYDEAAVNVAYTAGVFAAVDHPWTFIEPRSYHRIGHETTRMLVLDNDIRALFHVALAQRLDAVVSPDASATVRYVAGCLRTPLLLALSELAALSLTGEGPEAERWLHEGSLSRRPGTPVAVRMPFWFEAVVARAKDRREVASRIRAYRQEAATFRRHRAEIEHAVAARNSEQIGRIGAALSGDASALTSRAEELAKGALNTGDVALSLFAPLPFGLAQVEAAAAAAIGPDRRRSLAFRLFHRELRVVYNLQRGAARLANSLPTAFKLFGLPPGEAKEPLDFLDRLGDNTWLS